MQYIITYFLRKLGALNSEQILDNGDKNRDAKKIRERRSTIDGNDVPFRNKYELKICPKYCQNLTQLILPPPNKTPETSVLQTS